MEQNEKNEKPQWVAEIERLLPSARQNVGAICASVIQNLACIYSISHELYDAVVDVVSTEIYDSLSAE